jgi:hypothetical protein
VSKPKAKQSKKAPDEMLESTVAGSEEPEAEGAKRPAWLDALEMLINNPAGRKLALVTVAAIVFIVTIAIHYTAKWFNSEKPPATMNTTAPSNVVGVIGDQQPAPAVQLKLIIPQEFLDANKKKKMVEDEKIDAAPPLKIDPKVFLQNLEPRVIPLPLREPPRYVRNPAVDDEISLNHKDAVTNMQIVTRGFNKLPEDSKAWVVRRFTAEADAYANAVGVGWIKFVDLGYKGGPLQVGKQQFDAVSARMVQAKTKLQGRMTDADCVWVIEQLRFAVQFLHNANRNALRRSPITVPDFTEQPNASWQTWHQEYGCQKRN